MTWIERLEREGHRGVPPGGERAVIAMLREERPLTGELRRSVAQAARRRARRR